MKTQKQKKEKTEGYIQRKIIEALKDKGFYYIRTISSSLDGVPDIIACIKGRFVSFENKGYQGKVSDLQKYNNKKIKKNKGLAFVVSPYNYKDIIEWIRK